MRLEQTDTDWRALCDCSGEPRELVAVEGAERGLWSWHLRHALGGTVMACPDCGERAALAGAVVEGHGLLDLIREADLPDTPHVTLTPLQARTLDVSLAAEDMLAERARELAQEATGEVREGVLHVARCLRSRAQAEKLWTLRLILDEHGLEPLTGLRLARWDHGAATLYMADRGALPYRRIPSRLDVASSVAATMRVQEA